MALGALMTHPSMQSLAEAYLDLRRKLGCALEREGALLVAFARFAGVEAQRAYEQYNEVDPRNRLVASELERRWNEKHHELRDGHKRWNQTRVFSIWNRYRVPDSTLDPDVLHADAAARHCGVSVMAFHPRAPEADREAREARTRGG